METGSCVDRAIVLLMDPLGHFKNNFKTTGRSLTDVSKYTVDDFRRSSDES